MKWDNHRTWDDRVQTAIADGDYHQALDSLVRGYQDAIVGFCIHFLGEVDPGEDVAQEVFLAAYKAMPRYRQEASIRTWLFAIARKQCLKALRDRSRKTHKQNEKQEAIARGAHSTPQQTPEEELLEEERARLLNKGLGTLGKREKVPLIMRYVTGLSIAEIANILRISVPSVHRHLAQALQQLRRATER